MGKVEEFKFADDNSSKYGIITIYLDQDDMGRTFVTEDVLRRFHLEIPVLRLTLDTGEDIYEIEQDDVNYIFDHQDNKYAPYALLYQLFNFQNELEDEYELTHKKRKNKEDALDIINIFRDVNNNDRVFVSLGVVNRFHLDTFGDVVSLGDETLIYEINMMDAINIAAHRDNKYAPYVINYVDIQFTPAVAEALEPYDDDLMLYDEELNEEELEDYETIGIRPKRNNESERDYNIYLEGFFDGLSANAVENNKDFNTPRNQGGKESDEEYDDYLKTFYGRIIGAVDDIKKLGPSIIKRRPQKKNESDAEYNKWLAETAKIPIVETPLSVE